MRRTVVLSIAGGLLLTSVALSTWSLVRSNRIAYYYECEKACGGLPVITCTSSEIVCDATGVKRNPDYIGGDEALPPTRKARKMASRANVRRGG